jgi:ankyrin repeat protein
VLELVEKGADPHSRDDDGETPLFLAASAGHTQTVRALVLECGDKSSSSTASNNGTTPLYVAASNGHTEMVRTLVLEFGG